VVNTRAATKDVVGVVVLRDGGRRGAGLPDGLDVVGQVALGLGLALDSNDVLPGADPEASPPNAVGVWDISVVCTVVVAGARRQAGTGYTG
jgi:hypothetical protein